MPAVPCRSTQTSARHAPSLTEKVAVHTLHRPLISWTRQTTAVSQSLPEPVLQRPGSRASNKDNKVASLESDPMLSAATWSPSPPTWRSLNTSSCQDNVLLEPGPTKISNG